MTPSRPERSTSALLREVAVDSAGDGTVIAGGANGNRLVQALTRHNAGASVLMLASTALATA